MILKRLTQAVLLSLVLGTPAAIAAEDISIAVATPVTGPLANIGDQYKRGAEAAAAEINAKGGVLGGRQIKIVMEDDACDPKQAVSVANRVIAEGIKFVDGHTCSGATIPASAVYAEGGVLMMTASASSPVLTDEAAKNGWPTIMRLYTRDDAQGLFIGPWIAEKYKGKPVAILSLGTRLAEALKAADTLEARGLSTSVIDLRFAKPLDEELIRKTLANHEVCVTIEEGSIGGLGAHVLTLASDEGLIDAGLKLRTMRLPDMFQDQDSPQAQYDEAGLNAPQIVDCVLKALRHNSAGVEEAGARA